MWGERWLMIMVWGSLGSVVVAIVAAVAYWAAGVAPAAPLFFFFIFLGLGCLLAAIAILAYGMLYDRAQGRRETALAALRGDRQEAE